MGLDNYFMKLSVPEGIDWDKYGKLNLIGGMMSGHGNGSFRGKYYNGVIEAITGQTLYVENSEEAVSVIYEGLNKFIEENKLEDIDINTDIIQLIKDKTDNDLDDYLDEFTVDDLIQLRNMFRIANEEELSLIGWW